MIRFQSKAGADILMLGRDADAVLSALGREPAPQGIFEVENIDRALAAYAAHPPAGPAEAPGEDDENDAPDLARRAWPLVQLLRRAQSEGQTVTWSST